MAQPGPDVGGGELLGGVAVTLGQRGGAGAAMVVAQGYGGVEQGRQWPWPWGAEDLPGGGGRGPKAWRSSQVRRSRGPGGEAGWKKDKAKQKR